MKIEGVFAPIATPFKDNGSIDWELYSENLSKFTKTSLSGIVSLGSNGEFTMLSFEEKLELVKATKKGLSEDKAVIAGTGCESLQDTINLTNCAADAGADVALVINPCYYKELSETALQKYFEGVADKSKIPVMLYNMPRNSGVNLSSSLVIKLSAHPNINGVKDSSGNIVQISEIIASVPEDFSVFAGSGSFLFVTTILGGKGGTLAVANVAPDYCAELHQVSKAGNIEKGRKMQLDLLALNHAVTAGFGIGGMKAAMDIAGFFGGPPRLPIQPATDETKEKISKIMDKLQLVGKYKD
ncbi:MAG: dihydrodipicolinate synthase family protein [Synergistaceae bacterium]|nr:dihydrodipicolinate synthase family protein [Synergistaceae bacterium]